MAWTGGGITLIEVLVVIAIVCILSALVMSPVSRSLEKARRVKCQNQLRQFYTITVAYADEHGGLLGSYWDFLKQTPMLCPSDKTSGTSPSHWENSRPSSYDPTPGVFGDGRRLADMQHDWAIWIMLQEKHPWHDPSKKPAFDRGKWEGRFLMLKADGTTPWVLTFR